MIRNKKPVRFATAAVILVLLALIVTPGCGAGSKAEQNAYEKALLGKWAYLHDLDKAEASFAANGKAEFEGKKYRYSCDGEYIRFSDKDGEALALRYTQDNDDMTVYIKSKYVLEDGSIPQAVTGVWVCKEKNWTYEFTEKGTFLEDGILTGHYFVDEESGTIRLAYEELLEDTVFYYSLTPEGLFIEYPWPMKKIG